MARLARIVLPGLPHHVIQRGVRSTALFQSPDDRETSLRLLAGLTVRHAVHVWAWCLMTNHVHLVLVPTSSTALARAIGVAYPVPRIPGGIY